MTTGYRTGFWAVAFAFLVVMAFATLPSPLYGLYRERDGLSAFTITIVYAIWAAGTIAMLVAVPFIAERIGRRGVMLAAVATMMAAAGILVAWKALPGLLVGRLVTGFAVGMAAGTAIAYLIELRLHADPNASPAVPRTIGTSVNVGALGIGPLVAGSLAEWVRKPLVLTSKPTSTPWTSPLPRRKSWWTTRVTRRPRSRRIRPPALVNSMQVPPISRVPRCMRT